MACRHIKTDGHRCKSPALRGHAFCYFHCKLHTTTKISALDDISLPLPEDSQSIKLALKQIFDALLSSRIDSKRAGQLLYGLQIASQQINHKALVWDGDTIESTSKTDEGDELAPELRVCGVNDDCEGCEHAETCPNYDPDDDDDDDDDDVTDLVKAVAQASKNH